MDPRSLPFPRDSKCYQVVEVIGVGLRSVVHKAHCLTKQSTVVAIKIIDFEASPGKLNPVELQARTMASLVSHPNILKPHCAFPVGSRLWVVMPFFSGGSLLSVMASHNGIQEACIPALLKPICTALCYLHEKGHLHGDVKPGNILLDSDGSVSLGDLGFSASVCCVSDLKACRAPPYWVPPEVIKSKKWGGLKIDIWCLGITALELSHGRPLIFEAPADCRRLQMRINRRFGFADPFRGIDVGGEEKEVSQTFEDMVKLCLEIDPLDRPTAETLLQHDIFKNCNGSDFLKGSIVGLEVPPVDQKMKGVAFDDED